MTLKELHALLKTTGYPVAYYEFKKSPTLPFIVYIIPHESTYGDDFSNTITDTTYRVELYTAKKDLTAEGKVNKVLNFTEYNKNTTFIEGKTQDDNMYQTTYEFELIEKIQEEI